MNPTAQRREAPSPSPVAATPAAARKLAENLMDAMSALLAVIERETELVRAGKLREAMTIGAAQGRTVAGTMSTRSASSRRARSSWRRPRPSC